MAPRPSFAQTEALVEFLEQNPGIAKGLLRTSSAKAETKRKWAMLAISLNSLGGAVKDGIGWAKSEKKCALKKHCALHNASLRRTGGGPAANLPELGSLDHRMIAVMGGQDFGTGDEGLAPNPFPDSDVIIVPDIEASVPDSQIPVHLDHTTSQPTSPASHAHNTGAVERERSPHHATVPRLIRKRPRLRKVRPNSVETEMNRLAEIETRRVEAENTTAQAFAELSTHIDRMANMATALSSLASAILTNSTK